jgi:hypothetical protein
MVADGTWAATVGSRGFSPSHVPTDGRSVVPASERASNQRPLQNRVPRVYRIPYVEKRGQRVKVRAWNTAYSCGFAELTLQ